MPSSQLTIRKVDAGLSRRLRAISEERGESLNSTVLSMLRRAVGQDARRERLLRYATWTGQDGEEFEAALGAQRIVDLRDWQ